MSGAPANITELLKGGPRSRIVSSRRLRSVCGGSVKGKKVGTFGDLGIFSFQMNKNMTSGEGGAVVTNDARLYDRAFACHDLATLGTITAGPFLTTLLCVCGDEDTGSMNCALPSCAYNFESYREYRRPCTAANIAFAGPGNVSLNCG